MQAGCLIIRTQKQEAENAPLKTTEATEIKFGYKNLLKPFSFLCSSEFDFKNYRVFKSHPLRAQRKDLKQGVSFGIKRFPPCALWFDCRI